MLGELYHCLMAMALFTDGDISWVMVGNEKTPMSGTPWSPETNSGVY
jgi:hypothetical protein